jgi:acetate kinase
MGESTEHILVINCGSSSIKLRLIEIYQEKTVVSGLIEKIATPKCRQYFNWSGGTLEEFHHLNDHRDGLIWSLEFVERLGIISISDELSCVCHRIVHGGERFTDPVVITDDILNELRTLERLAPLHNPHNLTGIEIAKKLFPDNTHIAVFDTAFYRSLSPSAYRYAIPEWIYRDLGVRRYGFHGISHQYMAARAAELCGKEITNSRLITLHLGNGCSISAVKNGQCVETSMGMTPLEGLIMGTRCGDLDPSVPILLMRETGMTLAEAENLLNTESGLKGICGENDMRAIHRLVEADDNNAQLAVEMFVGRIKKYIGSYLAILNGADAIVFSGGIGENDKIIRQAVCTSLDYFGIDLDPELNCVDSQNNRIISTRHSKISLLVVPTEEEIQIAKLSMRMLQGSDINK